jgi:hypothetical protein
VVWEDGEGDLASYPIVPNMFDSLGVEVPLLNLVEVKS